MVTGPTTDGRDGDDGAGEPTRPLRVLDRPASEERTRPVPPGAAGEPEPGWEVLSRVHPEAGDRAGAGSGPGARQVLLQLVVGVLVILVLITLGGSWAARRLAEREAVNDAAGIADVLADTVVQPALTDALLDGGPTARARFDRVVREQVLGRNVVRVKIWGTDGTVLYADQPELVGRRFPLDPEEREVLRSPRTVAEISDLGRSENELDRVEADRLVEVYRPVWTSTGQEALFEIYTPYDQVSARTGQLWRGFAGLTLSSLLLFVALLTPLLWHLLARSREEQRQREELLRRAVDAQELERRRIAGSLHDGPVQDLAATSFVLAGATARARAEGQHDLARELEGSAGAVRTSIRALRSLLVDLHPPSLARAGLASALGDLAQSVRAPGLLVEVDAADDLPLDEEGQRLVHRVAQESLRNAAAHAAPCRVRIAAAVEGADVVLDVVDDGPGFDVARVLRDPAPGHLGVHLVGDLAREAGAGLAVRSRPGEGTHWQLRLPASYAGGRRS